MTAAPTGGRLDQGIVRGRGRRDVQPLRRAMRDNDDGIAIELAAEQQFLLIASGQAVCPQTRRWRADAETAANFAP